MPLRCAGDRAIDHLAFLGKLDDASVGVGELGGRIGDVRHDLSEVEGGDGEAVLDLDYGEQSIDLRAEPIGVVGVGERVRHA